MDKGALAGNIVVKTGRGGTADATDLKSVEVKLMWVQLPPVSLGHVHRANDIRLRDIRDRE